MRVVQKSVFVRVAAGVKMTMEYHLWRPEGGWHYLVGFQTMVAQALCKHTEYFSGLCRNVSLFLQKTAEILSLSQVSDLFSSLFVDVSS